MQRSKQEELEASSEGKSQEGEFVFNFKCILCIYIYDTKYACRAVLEINVLVMCSLCQMSLINLLWARMLIWNEFWNKCLNSEMLNVWYDMFDLEMMCLNWKCHDCTESYKFVLRSGFDIVCDVFWNKSLNFWRVCVYCSYWFLNNVFRKVIV